MRRLLAIIAFLVTGCTLWANGDPVATFCALTLSRNPIGVHVPEVQLKDEHLTVTPVGRYTLVRVEYLLYNNSKKDFVNLPYGFPIDYYRQGTERWASLDGNYESVAEVGWRDDYITEVAFTLNGIQLPFQISADRTRMATSSKPASTASTTPSTSTRATSCAAGITPASTSLQARRSNWWCNTALKIVAR